jgi:hypothetical protein
MPDLKTTFAFTGKASFPKNAVALIYDLKGLSRFKGFPKELVIMDSNEFNELAQGNRNALFDGQCGLTRRCSQPPLAPRNEIAQNTFTKFDRAATSVTSI